MGHALVSHAYHRGSSSLRTFLVKFQVGFLTHQTDPARVGVFLIVTKMAEIHKAVTIVCQEGILHAQRRHGLFQIQIGVGVYERYREIHLIVLIIGLIPVLAVHGCQQVVDCLPVLRQEDGHLIGAVAIRENDACVEVRLCV